MTALDGFALGWAACHLLHVLQRWAERRREQLRKEANGRCIILPGPGESWKDYSERAERERTEY